jgi:hypothetical protein
VPHLEVDPLLEAFSRRLMAKRRDARPATAKAARELLDLIDGNRHAAAAVLGVPLARSGRTPAMTEPVDPDESSGAVLQVPETVRLRSTPSPGAPVWQTMADAAPGMPFPEDFTSGVTGDVPGELAPAPSPESGLAGQAMVVPGPLARPGLGPYGPRGAQGSHRDTSLRTPLGWQTASLPGRRRSWLIGGAAVGTACVAAVVLLFTSVLRDEPAEADRSAGLFSVAATGSARPQPPSSGDPRPAADPATHEASEPAVARTPVASPAVARTPVASPAVADHRAGQSDRAEVGRGAGDRRSAAMPVAKQVDAVRSPADDERKRVPPTPPRKAGGASSPRGSTAPRSAGGSRAGASAADVAAAPEREPATRAPAVETRDARPTRSDPPGTSNPRPHVAISAAALRGLYDATWAEIVPLPPAKKADLTSQMLVFKINDALRAKDAERDRAAAELSQVLEEARRRKVQP